MAEYRAFLASALQWIGTGDEQHARRLLRSPFSGVPSELAGAYATLSAREGPLAQLLAHERIAAAGERRESVLRFARTLTTLLEARALNRDAQVAIVLEAFSLHESQAMPAPEKCGFPELAPAVSPEEPEGVALPSPRFSASALNTYAECARKWFYRYVCAAVEDRGSSASFYGTAFHAALETFHGEYQHPLPSERAELLRKLEGYLNDAFERHRAFFATPVEYELQRRRAQRTAVKYVDWLIDRARRSPFTVIGCELPAQLQLDGYEFIGYIDRLDRDDSTGNVSVIDYKTGSIASTAQEYRELVCAAQDFQLPFYYWARTMEGDRVSTLALVPLKDALLDVAPIELEVLLVPTAPTRSKSTKGTISIAELEQARKRMIEICAELSGGFTRSFAASQDASACTYCAYVLACSGRPIAVPGRFAR